MRNGTSPHADPAPAARAVLPVDAGTDAARMLARLAEAEAHADEPSSTGRDPHASLRTELARLAERVRRLPEQPTPPTAAPVPLEERLARLAGEVEALRSELADTRAHARAATLLVDELRMRLVRAERDTPRELEGTSIAAPASVPAPALRPRLEPSAGLDDGLAFLARLRGTRDENRARLRRFADAFFGRRAVLDLGCGRGEFLEALAEIEVPATGVERDADLAAFCRDLSLPVAHADVNAHLAALEPRSLDGVFSSDLLEHLTLAELSALVARLRSRVAPGGVVVFRTANPYCPWSFGVLSIQPTHVRAYAPELLGLLFESNGFEVRSIEYSPLAPGNAGPESLTTAIVGHPDVAKYLEYALTATRTALP